MIDKPVWKPVKDFTYLKDVTVGELVNTNSGLKAVVLEHTECASLVLVLNADNHSNEDKQFYLGKHRWGNKTEVKIIGD
jgi:preprotein translocase subunit YajC